jgi:hypothetical protein
MAEQRKSNGGAIHFGLMENFTWRWGKRELHEWLKRWQSSGQNTRINPTVHTE